MTRMTQYTISRCNILEEIKPTCIEVNLFGKGWYMTDDDFVYAPKVDTETCYLNITRSKRVKGVGIYYNMYVYICRSMLI